MLLLLVFFYSVVSFFYLRVGYQDILAPHVLYVFIMAESIKSFLQKMYKNKKPRR